MNNAPTGRRVRRWLVVPVAAVCMMGMSGLPAVASGATAATSGPETRPFEPGEEGMQSEAVHTRSNAPSHVPSKNVPRPGTLPVNGNAAAKRIEGLTMKDQRDANNGNSWSLEPPDQALCVSGGQVIEGVNSVFSIYDKRTGAASGPAMSYNQ